MNRDWNNSKVLQRMKNKNNPDIWKHYHKMFEERKKLGQLFQHQN